jgi:CRISPR-associated protein Csd1
MTGQEAQIARLHPSIKGVQGGQSSGASIVSFNLDAFTSYGKEQGANAPVSDVAAFAYTTALNALLSRMRGRTEKGQPIYANRVQVADATTVFWAEADKPAQSAWADSFIAGLFDPRDDADENEVDPHRDRSEGAKVRTVLDAIARGRPLEDAAPEIDTERTRYFVLGLSPNAARISVRFWHQGTLGELAGRFQQHWRDLQIEPVPWKSAPAIWALLYEIAAQRKAENIPPSLAGEVMRAILTARPYPRSLFTATIMRCRADRNITGMRAAILKACLIRTEKEDVPVSLNRDNANPGYRLGRLFAVLENVQKTALPGLNATIRDRFYGAASATPGCVFPMLMRNTSHHLSNIRKGDKPRLAPWFEKEIGEIVLGLDGNFPKTLRLEDQGRFAIGYYQQRYAKKAHAPAELAQDLIAEDTNDTIEE